MLVLAISRFCPGKRRPRATPAGVAHGRPAFACSSALLSPLPSRAPPPRASPAAASPGSSSRDAGSLQWGLIGFCGSGAVRGPVFEGRALTETVVGRAREHCVAGKCVLLDGPRSVSRRARECLRRRCGLYAFVRNWLAHSLSVHTTLTAAAHWPRVSRLPLARLGRRRRRRRHRGAAKQLAQPSSCRRLRRRHRRLHRRVRWRLWLPSNCRPILKGLKRGFLPVVSGFSTDVTSSYVASPPPGQQHRVAAAEPALSALASALCWLVLSGTSCSASHSLSRSVRCACVSC